MLSNCYLAFAQSNPKRDLSPPWYKRFVGKIGNETGIIHIQKSYKGALIMIYTYTQKLEFSDNSITFLDNKIEAKTEVKEKATQVFRAYLQNDRLLGTLQVGLYSMNIDAKEDYTQAIRVKLYEYSYVETGNFPTFIGEAKYYYHYGLNAVPEYLISDFERQNILKDTYKKYMEGLKGEIKAIENEQFLSETSFEKVIYNQNNLLIIASIYYIYEGGAHGMYSGSYMHYDLEQKKIVQLQDIFYPNYKAALGEIILRKAKEIGVHLYDDIQKIEPSGDFLLDEQGITFVYQPYEIAPYSEGIVEITLPYSEIRALLKPTGPHKRIMK